MAVVPSELKPASTLRRYSPFVVLDAPLASEVAPRTVERAVRVMVQASRLPWVVVGGIHEVCGVEQTARRVAGAGGAFCLRSGEGMGDEWAVVEYLPGLAASLVGRDPLKTVVSCHIYTGDVGRFPRVLFRGHHAFVQQGAQHEHSRYLPLPTLGKATAPAEWPGDETPFTFVWHGIVNARKGLQGLVSAFWRARQTSPRLRLLLLGSTGAPWADRAIAQQVASRAGDGLEVDFRPAWTDDALRRRLAEANAFAYADELDKEQSAAVQDVLGFGKPVLTSARTCHDDTRGWCWTMGQDPAPDLVCLAARRDDYECAARRAWLGGSYRQPELIARAYRAAILQAFLDAHM